MLEKTWKNILIVHCSYHGSPEVFASFGEASLTSKVSPRAGVYRDFFGSKNGPEMTTNLEMQNLFLFNELVAELAELENWWKLAIKSIESMNHLPHCLGFHFGLQLGKSINWWPKKMVSLQNLQTFDHFTLTLVVAEKRLNTDIKRVGHRRNLETHSSERYRGSELVARSHCDSLDLHPRNGFYSELYLILLHISGSL